MATVTMQGNNVNVNGTLPSKGDTVSDFELVGADLGSVKLSDFAGKRKVLNIFPSIDTGVCATSVRKFNEQAAALDNTVVLGISEDLPFAQARFCGAEGIENVKMGSAFRNSQWAEQMGVAIADGPLAGLTARAVVVLDEDNTVLHSQLVPEITSEPDYDAALDAAKTR